MGPARRDAGSSNTSSNISEPLRLPDLLGHIRSMGLPELRPPLPVGPVVSFLAAPVLHRGERVGNLYVAEKEGVREFTREDEETLGACSRPRRQWSSPTPAGTGTRRGPGTTWRR